jgi:hypothetical protein
MADKENPAYVELRRGVRGLLDEIGIPSNPAVDDSWIVNQLRSKANLPPAEALEQTTTDNFILFQNSLAQIVIELGKQVPEPDDRGELLEARRLVHILYSLLS